MFVSQLRLDRMHKRNMRLLSDVYGLHQAVMSGFRECKDSQRVLYRVEPDRGERFVNILIQSRPEPSWDFFSGYYGGIADCAVKEFSPVFSQDDTFRFRLRANPTVKKNGKRYGLVRDDALEDWLRRKESQHGVRFLSISVADEGYLNGTKKGEGAKHLVNLKTALYEGVLSVSDPGLMEKALIEGIGPAKAFGCGLLSLARA